MNVSIKTVTLAALVGLQTLAMMVILSSSYVSSERAVLGQSRHLMVESAEHTRRHIQSFLRPAEMMLEVSTRLYDTGSIEAHEDQAIERYFFEQLRASPELSGLFHGDEHGNFLFVSRSSDVQGARFRTKIISNSDSRSGASLTYRDNEFREVESRFDANDTYDPRQRPWYRDAIARDGVTWTDPYVFYSSKQPGITLAKPVGDVGAASRGVIGIDLEIADLSRFLANLAIGENGKALVLGANGDVIAHPDPSKISKPKLEGATGLRFAKVNEIGDPVASAAMDALKAQSTGVDFSRDRSARFESDEQIYHAVFAPIKIGALEWTLAIYVPEVDLLGEIISNRYRNIALAVTISCIVILIGWIVSELVARRLKKLTVFADRVALGETPDPAELPGTFTELAQVSVAFRRLTHWLDDYRRENQEMNGELVESARTLEGRVEERTASLLEANVRLRHEIAERAEAERKLAEEIGQHRETSQDLRWALADAHEASRAKSRFLSGMSHELRTPLNSIIGFGQLLDGQAGSLSEDQKTEYNGYILESGERLLALINQVLDLAGIEAGRTLLTIEKVKPETIIRRVLTETSVLAHRRELTLIDETVDADLPAVSADAMRMTQCLINLVANAIKYNRQGGEVRVSASETAAGLRVAVTDTGIGIPKSLHSEVFETFNRLGAEATTAEGSGIGLSLTKQLVGKMNGTVGFESAEGQGSTFWIELPLDNSEPDNARLQRAS